MALTRIYHVTVASHCMLEPWLSSHRLHSSWSSHNIKDWLHTQLPLKNQGNQRRKQKKNTNETLLCHQLAYPRPYISWKKEHVELIGKEAASCQPQLFQRGPWTIEDSLKHNKLKTQQKHHVQTNIHKSSSPELDEPLGRSKNIPIQMHSCTHLTTALLRLNPPESDTSISNST